MAMLDQITLAHCLTFFFGGMQEGISLNTVTILRVNLCVAKIENMLRVSCAELVLPNSILYIVWRWNGGGGL